MTKIIRVAAIVLAVWMIVAGVLAVVASVSHPTPGLMPIAGLMGVVFGILLVLALWAFPPTGRRGRAYGDDED